MAKPVKAPQRSAPAHKPPTRKPSAPVRQPAARKERSAAHSSRPRWKQKGLSPERKLDLVGIVMALIGLLSLLSFLSSQQGETTNKLFQFFRQIAGWGGFLIPLALLIFGMWLVFRNVDKLPALSTERVTGFILLYLNLLTWMHLIGGGTWELARSGKGGGFLGAIFDIPLESGIDKAGTIVVLLAWLLLAMAMTLDISVPELFHWFRKNFRRPGLSEKPRIIPEDETSDIPISTSGLRSTASSELPPEFNPLPSRPQSTISSAPRIPVGEKRPGQNQGSSTPLPASHIPEAHAEPPPTGSITWQIPSVEAILDPASPASIQTSYDQERARVIETTLGSFGAPAHVVEVHRGPTVTQYGVEPDFIETRNGRTRVRVSKIVSLADDLALALAAQRIRIQAPVPGRNYVGIEVPNSEISRVALREVMESDPFRKMGSSLKLALGKDVAGKSVVADLASMPHLLIAGTTGSGKSVCVNSVLSCLLLDNSPADLRLVLVDPKRVELTGYNGIPHLLAPVVVDAERVIGALQWMLREMDNRYKKFAKVGARNIKDYNGRNEEHLPYLVVVIDELADLMMLAPDETERSITRLAQLSRATGIHLILATQRPSVDVVTGLIKANFPARIAFAVASGVDSRVILDQPGAERLLGRGDMLFQAPDAPAPVRIQGVYVSDNEIQRLVDTWRVSAAQADIDLHSDPSVDALPRGVPLKQAPLWEGTEAISIEDPLLEDAIDLVRREGRASISMLQRRMRIGYTRAARLVDRMEEKNIISPQLTNSQVREVLDYGPTAPPGDDGN